MRTQKIERPYEQINITGVQGISEAQKVSLHLLGAIEDDEKTRD